MKFLLLAQVNVNKLLIILALIAAIAVVFAALIVLVSKLCAVPVNEKAEKIHEKLAGANCGGCGFAGCADFAKALAEGKADFSACGPTPAENKAEIARILGLEYSSDERKIAVVHCAGGKNCLDKFEYVGNRDCNAQIAFMGGKKSCDFGCLGGGTCAEKCAYNAVYVTESEVAKVNGALCEACGLCVKACPKHLIDFVPYTAKVYVACSSQCKGKDVMNSCKAGCIGCGICAKFCPEHAITMENNLSVIDYGKCTACKTCVAKCPRKCIKEFNA